MNGNLTQTPKRKTGGGMHSAKVKDTVFFWIIAIIPLIMLVFNWVFINLNSIMLAFKSYDDFGNATFSGLDNIKAVFWAYRGGDPKMVQALQNSIVVYLVSVVVTAVIPIIKQ